MHFGLQSAFFRSDNPLDTFFRQIITFCQFPGCLAGQNGLKVVFFADDSPLVYQRKGIAAYPYPKQNCAKTIWRCEQ